MSSTPDYLAKSPARSGRRDAFIATGLIASFAVGMLISPLIRAAAEKAQSLFQSARYEYVGWNDKLRHSRANKWFVGYLRVNNSYPVVKPEKYIRDGAIDWKLVAKDFDVVTFGQFHKDPDSYAYVKSQLPAMAEAGFSVFLQEAPPDVISSQPLGALLAPLVASYPTAGREIYGVLTAAHDEGMRYGGFDVSRPSLSARPDEKQTPAELDASRNVGMANYVQNWDAAYYRSNPSSSPLKFVTLNGASHTGHKVPGDSSTLNDALAGLGYRSFVVDVCHPRYVWRVQRETGRVPTGRDSDGMGPYSEPKDNDRYPIALPSSGQSNVVVLCGPLRPR